jgi:hypothetical protein
MKKRILLGLAIVGAIILNGKSGKIMNLFCRGLTRNGDTAIIEGTPAVSFK